jgi:hypothetical protein
LPPAAATLGLELIDADVENGTIEVAFAAIEDFITPRGDVLEGFLAAMLHEVVGPALLATRFPAGGAWFTATATSPSSTARS